MGLSLKGFDGSESLNQQSAVAKASFEKDGVSWLLVNMLPYSMQVAHSTVELLVILQIINCLVMWE